MHRHKYTDYVLTSTQTLKVIGHNHYLDLGNGSNKFGYHCSNRKDIFSGYKLAALIQRE